MKLRELLKHIKEMVDENPDALDMEIYTTNGASGGCDPLSYCHVQEVDEEMDDYYGLGVGNFYVDFYNGN